MELPRCARYNEGAPSSTVPTRELHTRLRSSLVTTKELLRYNSAQRKSYAYYGAPSLGYDATRELLRRQNRSPLATLFTCCNKSCALHRHTQSGTWPQLCCTCNCCNYLSCNHSAEYQAHQRASRIGQTAELKRTLHACTQYQYCRARSTVATCS